MLPNLSALAQPTEVKRDRAGNGPPGQFGDLSLEPPDPAAQALARMGPDDSERPATLQRQNAYNQQPPQPPQGEGDLSFMPSAVDALRDAMAGGGLDPADEPTPALEVRRRPHQRLIEQLRPDFEADMRRAREP